MESTLYYTVDPDARMYVELQMWRDNTYSISFKSGSLHIYVQEVPGDAFAKALSTLHASPVTDFVGKIAHQTRALREQDAAIKKLRQSKDNAWETVERERRNKEAMRDFYEEKEAQLSAELQKALEARDKAESLYEAAKSLIEVREREFDKMWKQLAKRKTEVQTLQEACRKHREARRVYWWKLYYLRGQLYSRGRTIWALRNLIERYEGHAILRIKATYPVPDGTKVLRFECSACGNSFEWTSIAHPEYCPWCPQKFRISGTPTRTADED